VDIVKEYDKILDETLNAKPSTLYRLLTGLPVPYTLAPERLRDFLMRKRGGKGNLTFCDKLPLDALRFILVRAIEEILGEKLERKKWNGKKYVCIITHDIDTRRGLRRARVIKKLEEKYDVPSAWYIPTKYYKLDFEIVRELANHGEIGSHGTRHDGKLVQLSNQKLVKRLVESKKTLEEITSSPVKGFRAPLLNLNVKMIEALQKACYTYDASVPTWEPKHPYTMKPYGIGTMNLVKIDRIFEIPVSFPQDHQMIHVLGLSARQTVEKWLEMRDVTREIGGVCTILVHPDYELGRSENSGIYEELLSAFSADDHTWITTPLEVVEQRC
jgi:peptidoglycan/xylan/chitin deacetylase (PgdA/CDA1 family)